MVEEIGRVSHYYNKAGVAVVDLDTPLNRGETVTFQRGGVQFSQAVASMQIDHENVEQADAGSSIGLKVDQPVKPGAVVWRGEPRKASPRGELAA